MHNLKEELDDARNRIDKLNVDFVKELDQKFALSKQGKKRITDDGKAWQDLLKSMNIDLSKILEHSKADAKKTQETLKGIRSSLENVPKEILLQSQESIRIDEVAGQAWGNIFHKKFYITSAIAGHESIWVHKLEGSPGTVEGNCGNITYGPGYPNSIMPRSLVLGDGLGFDDIDEISLDCSLWFLIPGEFIQQPGTLSVSPYFDIHGYYWDRANEGHGTIKEAGITLKISTMLYPYNRLPATTSEWKAINYYGTHIDQSGRFDYTGYNNAAKGSLQVSTGEPLLVQVVVELEGLTRGAGSIGLLDFQTGVGNGIRIPNLLCWLEYQPLILQQ
jgi:hypothetical protein